MYCSCGNPVENRDTGKCGTCSHAERKAAKVKEKKVYVIPKVSAKLAIFVLFICAIAIAALVIKSIS